MPYIVMIGLLIVTLGIAIVSGGWTWLLPVIVWPMVIAYMLWDRRAKAHESRGERMASR